jgi:hypothetical protein
MPKVTVAVFLVVVIVSLASWLSSGHEITPNDNVRRNPESGLVDEIVKPGAVFTPSIGKRVHVFELNDKYLMGIFVSYEDHVIRFLSTCSGFLHIYRNDGSNIIEHHFVSKKRGVHHAEIEKSSFVYGDGKTYAMNNRRSKRETEELFKNRKKRSDISDDVQVQNAVRELRSDEDAWLIEQLTLALGDFGIVGSNSPCALFLYTTAKSVTRLLLTNTTDEDTTSDQTAKEGENGKKYDQPEPRRRRSWWSRKKPDCEEYPNRDKQCLGMCGKQCTCWRYVCNDCCYHQGCYEHDICCIHFWTWDCLFPVGFDCDRYPPYPCGHRHSDSTVRLVTK